ncbi:MAG: shikimate kinase [Leptolyngbya sp. PLA2]|nr:shikimate kinase [Leptolyngbya sp.]MCE7972024.1 shikimate kinase [Leptolyngbya sp. PL-A2]MCQ3940958.1 shikimate kinase [cyanobacterium CYA1]MCZ7634005.1 shikimate kinase [Phycisphaerales bacterium]MDL1905270.1 shikimate kinase [Synechococcales cyanobacterium CNB]GIK19174.1 MAG: shikimate kinase [Planctomycetota bacterium]
MDDPRASILLIGLRGSGKSALGPRLAERLGRPFIDLDAVTVTYLGEGTLRELWERHGEVRFRQAEYRALVNQAFPRTNPGPVVALGGGTPTAPGAADFLRNARARGMGRIVYLRAAPATLRARLAGADNADRPSLTGADPLAEIEAVHAARDPLYRELADAVVEVDGLNEAATLGAVVRSLPGPVGGGAKGTPGNT